MTILSFEPDRPSDLVIIFVRNLCVFVCVCVCPSQKKISLRLLHFVEDNFNMFRQCLLYLDFIVEVEEIMDKLDMDLVKLKTLDIMKVEMESRDSR